MKPAIILDRIALIRTVSPGTSPSFSGFELHEALPALQSMLEFPPVADSVQRSTLVWKALSSITGDLTPLAFITAINKILSKQIAAKEEEFHILTALSLASEGFSAQLRIEDSTILLLNGTYPKKYSARAAFIVSHSLPVDETPDNYCRVVVKVIAKSPYEAMTKALRALDLQRAIWCLLCNSRMEIIGQEWNPINKVRLGSVHTTHKSDGSIAGDEIWFEPNFARADVFKPETRNFLQKNSRYAFRQLARCSYGNVLSDALLRYVRALDERDQNTAFLRLWGAIESLTSPGIASYDQIVRRCSFLYQDAQYHQQILEHLRACRNQSVHAGDQSVNAKTHCFQLQQYFFQLLWFHLANVRFFKSLDETNAFLDLKIDKAALFREKQLIEKAIRFIW